MFARHSGASAPPSSAASGRWPAATRPAAARSPGRWSPPPSSSTRKRIPRGLDDSKKLDRRAEREKLYHKICASAEVAVAVALAGAHRSRQYPAGIAVGAGARGRGAAGAAEARVRRRPRPHRGRLRLRGGDLRRCPGASIAAASIVAKVMRDRLMMRLGAAHPGYGFERHMGYSVPEHFARPDAARAHHPSPPLVRPGRRRLLADCGDRRDRARDGR